MAPLYITNTQKLSHVPSLLQNYKDNRTNWNEIAFIASAMHCHKYTNNELLNKELGVTK